MRDEIKFFINRNLSFHRYEISAFSENNGVLAVAAPLEFELQDPAIHVEPTMTLQRDELQNLLDELIRLGFQPSDQRYLNQQLSIKDDHLQDMRKIVSSKLKVDL